MNELKNTDKEIWREIEGEYYSPSIFVTEQGKIGINVGGYVYVQSVEKWHQQADRIKDLEKLLEHSVGADCREMRYIQEIENKDARIAELEKQQKTEPDFYSEQGYPLYTTPQIKQLSDEEIHQIFRDESGFEIDTCPIAILDFARAILKKASQ